MLCVIGRVVRVVLIGWFLFRCVIGSLIFSILGIWFVISFYVCFKYLVDLIGVCDLENNIKNDYDNGNDDDDVEEFNKIFIKLVFLLYLCKSDGIL